MTDFQRAVACLPAPLRDKLTGIPLSVQERIQEIRLRAGAPVELAGGGRVLLLTQNGDVTEIRRTSPYICDAALLAECFQALCEYSVHTHQQEIRRGFISTRTGCRAGIAGSVVTENGDILSMRGITSICLRVARQHTGCADSLASVLLRDGRIGGALICGEPSSGKTSLLRDLARQLSDGSRGRRYHVSVVDERGELGSGRELAECDVLLYCPKDKGIEQAVRCLAPDVVIFDELGTPEETRAVTASLNAGTAVIATAHCRDLASLLRRPHIAEALRTGAFEHVVMLSGRDTPGHIDRILRTEDVWNENIGPGADYAGGRLARVVGGLRTEPAGSRP